VTEAVKLGAAFIDLHVSGGEAMLKAAVSAARKARGTGSRPRLLGVTILTSMDPGALATLGLRGSVRGLAVKLARVAQGAGLDGVVASGHEVEAIKKACGPSFLVVVPGIRPAGSATGDQKRTATPAQALLAGADYIVVGRPITRAADPAAAADAILAEMGA
jgi:orotidine-5'-phosphate decarboxylase